MGVRGGAPPLDPDLDPDLDTRTGTDVGTGTGTDTGGEPGRTGAGAGEVGEAARGPKGLAAIGVTAPLVLVVALIASVLLVFPAVARGVVGEEPLGSMEEAVSAGGDVRIPGASLRNGIPP